MNETLGGDIDVLTLKDPRKMRMAAGSLTKENSKSNLGGATMQESSQLLLKKQLLSDASKVDLGKSDIYVFEGGESKRNSKKSPEGSV